MCGIAGIVAPSGFDPQVLVSMTHLAKHRGPDGFGFVYFDLDRQNRPQCFHNEDRYPSFPKPTLGLGSRRLAILDLSTFGNMPMQVENGELWITFNGEIYNYLEIRAELEALGHPFRTRTDTEVILRAYQQWGPPCVDRLSGMWSFAIYDRERSRLFCSRDRFGIKPFYYFASASVLLFASEIKQILDYPGIARQINDAVAFQYLEQGVQDHTEDTFFVNIRQLLPGHSLHVSLSAESFSMRIEKYWELPLADSNGVSPRRSIEQFSELLKRSVRRHLRSDVPVGSCLSGGLDSSSIVAVAASEIENQSIHAFSSCFDKEALDERPFIQTMVSSAGLRSHLVFPNEQGFWKDLSCLIWHQDEPVGGTSVYAQWCVMQAARLAKIPVLLDGQGGDEILCGYRKFYVFYLLHLMKKGRPRVISEALSWLIGPGRHGWSWNHAKRYLSNSTSRKRWSLVTRVCDPDFCERSKAFSHASIGPGKSLRQRQKDDLMFYSLPALLHYEDRNSMAHSVESRVPLLDHELAAFSVNCAPELKLRGGWTKWILREALKGTLPEAIRQRKSKLGFETPQGQWLREDVGRTIRSLTEQSAFRAERILSLNRVHKQLALFLSGGPGALDELEAFRVLSLELWSRVFGVS